MAQPVLFATIEKSMKIESGTVEKWTTEPGFPLAGSGVAVLAEVIAWRKKLEFPNSTSPPVVSDIAAACVAEPPVELKVVWVTIRVPMLAAGPTLPGSNPVQSLRILGSERHIKDTWGKVLQGCRAESVRMRSGKVVKTSADSLKFVFEQICDAISKA